ncbi:hypothetical protein A8L45_00855 [Veronia pacifica]|uniref:L-alanine exporter AlaE n=2 Tax=Veronia pacifica TaxID=1080227 RepID=A0A1C3ESJ9_9GAMM|nr:hypothetical protein A8L45_00855 [Veronia pacifica]
MKRARLRAALVDTFAMVIFCFITGMCIEVFISGLTVEQSIQSRFISIPINVLIAWPYGFFRDKMIAIATSMSSKQRAKTAADFIAYVAFQSPIYMVILFVVGAEIDQIFTAVGANALVSGALGVVYGIFLEHCRRWFKVELATAT